MRATVILGVSAAAHAVVLLALPGPSVPLVRPRPAVVTIEEEAPVVTDVTPFELMTLPATDTDTASAPAAAPATTTGHASGSRSGSSAASITASGTGAIAIETGPAGDTDAANPFSMRNAARNGLDLSVGGDVLDEILNRPPRPTVEPTGKIDERANNDGSHTARDLVFTAVVNPDGTIRSIEDKPNFHVSLHLPHPKRIARALKKHMADWVDDPYGMGEKTGVKGPKVGADGDDKETSGETVTIISGGFDLTDAAERLAGNDPYAARKRAFLAETFDERVQMGIEYRSKQMAESDQIMLGNLKKLWVRHDLDAIAKRELIFELWDECAETGNDDLVAAAQRARDALARFVQVHLPEGSAEGFTADELAHLNAHRASKATFDPYGSGVP